MGASAFVTYVRIVTLGEFAMRTPRHFVEVADLDTAERLAHGMTLTMVCLVKVGPRPRGPGVFAPVRAWGLRPTWPWGVCSCKSVGAVGRWVHVSQAIAAPQKSLC